MTTEITPGTSAWFEARCASWTASRAPALMGRLKDGKPAAPYHDLIGENATERLTGVPATHFKTAAMQRGIELEPEAADAYSLERMVPLGDSRLVMHPDIDRVCATPDRFVGEDGLLEVKVPAVQAKHLDTLRRGKRSIEGEYSWQCHFQLWCCPERKWVDLMSYSPLFPAGQQLAIVRIERDEEKFAQLAEAVEQAERDVAEILDELERITLGQRESA